VYATCSGEPEENEEVVGAFLTANPAFRAVDLNEVEVWRSGDRARLLDAEGRLRTLPHLHGLEAFFAAVLVRTAA